MTEILGSTRRRAVAVGVASLLLVATAAAAKGTSVSTSSPRSIAVTQGSSAVTVSLTGQGLNEVSSAELIDAKGYSVKDTTVSLQGTKDPTRRTISVKAGPKAPAAKGYRLRLVAGRSTIVVSTKVASVEVKWATTFSGHTEIMAYMSCAECHDVLQENATDKYSWSSYVVTQAAVQKYNLNINAYGATLEQIVQGDRKVRNDAPCSACHGANPVGNDRTLTNIPYTTFCSTWVPVFLELDSKPNNLKTFFASWKDRSCPN